MNAKEFFKSKDHYLYFRKMWAEHVNAKGLIRAHHHVIYNILRGRDPFHGFSPVTAKRKLYPGQNPHRYYDIVDWFMRALERQYKDYITSAMAPFGGTITAETLLQVCEVYKQRIEANKEAA